jgi:hypothetical protein
MIIESAIEISAVINRLALIRATFLRAWWICGSLSKERAVAGGLDARGQHAGRNPPAGASQLESGSGLDSGGHSRASQEVWKVRIE